MSDPQHYYPANATEGAAFERRWCDHCVHAKDAWVDELGDFEGCLVLASSSCDQPKEWVYRHGMPWCLAFVEDRDNPARCLFTKEMF